VAGIFISYRREDCAGHAGRLYDRLAEHFGEQRVFMDIDAIEPGVDFAERIAEAVGACDVLIALIGADWLDVRDARGRRRLDDGADFVRRELAAGLERTGLRVIPVLVEGASMPDADDLPEDLKGLARRNAFPLSDARWRYDAGRLTEALERIAGPPKTRGRVRLPVSLSGLRRPSRLVLAAGAAVTATTVAALIALLGGGGGAERGTGNAVLGPVRVGGEAGQPTVRAGRVWVPLGTKSTVARVDPRTGGFDEIRDVGDYPASASAGDGAVWVADSAGNQVFRIDAREDTMSPPTVSPPIEVGDEPNDIAVGEGFVWTANCACSKDAGFSVSRIDPKTRDVTTFDVPDRPLGIGTGDGRVWVASGAEGTVRQIDPRTRRLVGDPIRVGAGASDVVVDRSGIWVAVSEEGMVVRIDPETLRRVTEVNVGGSPHRLALGGGFLWVTDDGDGTLRRVDTSSAREVGPSRDVGANAGGVAFGEGRAWVVNHKPGRLLGVAP
jgi:DNA-binding beta-propeller fold protein YncE